MKYSKLIAILAVFLLPYILESEGHPRRRRPQRKQQQRHKQTCEEYRDIAFIMETEEECSKCKPQKKRVCEFHWVEIPGGGKRWAEDKSRCTTEETSNCSGPQKCTKKFRRVPKSIKKYRPIGDTPCLTQMGTNENGVPMVEIQMPDGTNDTMNMGFFMGMEDAFIGTMEREGTPVAMTEAGDHRELTVLSSHMGKSSMMKWFPDGQVEMMEEFNMMENEPDPVITPDPVEGDNDGSSFPSYDYGDGDSGYGYGRRRRKRQATMMGHRRKRQADDPPPSAARASELDSFPTTVEPALVDQPMGLTVKFVTTPGMRARQTGNDDSEANKAEVENIMIQQYLPHMQARFCSPTLQTNIVLRLPITQTAYNDRENTMGFALADNIDRSLAFRHLDEGDSPSNFQAQNDDVPDSTQELTSNLIQDERIDFLRGTLDEPKLVIFVENDPQAEPDVDILERDGTLGVAYRQAVCRTHINDILKQSVNEVENDVAQTADTIAHEIGHNLGMFHDFDLENGGQDLDGDGEGDTTLTAEVRTTDGCESDGNVMSYGAGVTYKWSECSNTNFRDWYDIVTTGGAECQDVTDADTGEVDRVCPPYEGDPGSIMRPRLRMEPDPDSDDPNATRVVAADPSLWCLPPVTMEERNMACTGMDNTVQNIINEISARAACSDAGIFCTGQNEFCDSDSVSCVCEEGLERQTEVGHPNEGLCSVCPPDSPHPSCAQFNMDDSEDS